MKNVKYARSVEFHVKNGKMDEFTRVFTTDVLPLLKQQKGFKEELTLVNADRALGISVWEDRPSAETYHMKTYPQVLSKLAPVIEGTPRVNTYDVTASTF